jgi:hypothetical protein
MSPTIPSPPPVNSFVIGTAVINTHTLQSRPLQLAMVRSSRSQWPRKWATTGVHYSDLHTPEIILRHCGVPGSVGSENESQRPLEFVSRRPPGLWPVESGVSRLRGHPEGPESCQSGAQLSSRSFVGCYSYNAGRAVMGGTGYQA